MEDELRIRRPDDMHPAEWADFVERVHDELSERSDALPFKIVVPIDGPLVDSAELGKVYVGIFGI